MAEWWKHSELHYGVEMTRICQNELCYAAQLEVVNLLWMEAPRLGLAEAPNFLLTKMT